MTVDLQLDEHRVPDGTRPLVITRESAAIAAALLEPTDTEQLTCHVVVHNTTYKLPIPAECRREIRPGEHYLLHTQRMAAGTPTGLTWAYCAPCAIRDYAWWGVHEVQS